MTSIFKIVLLLLSFISLTTFGQVSKKVKREGKQTVVFLGNSITYQGDYIKYFETYWNIKHPDANVDFINLGLPSETVSGLSEEDHAGGKFPRPVLNERLSRILDSLSIDLVVACYGMNDGIFLPFDKKREKKYISGMKALNDTLMAREIPVVYMTPAMYDPKGEAAFYTEVLDRYSNWLVEQRKRGWEVIDMHYFVENYVIRKREQHPEFVIAEDAIHPNDEGHWLMTLPLINYFSNDSLSAETSKEEVFGDINNFDSIYKLISYKQNLQRDAWLTHIGYNRPGLPQGIPIKDLQIKKMQIQKELESFHHITQ